MPRRFRFRFRCATRRRLIWLVTLLMVWQQVALAAHVCPMTPQSTGRVTEMTSADPMAAMDADCPDMQRAISTPLCQQHCVPDHATQVDARAPSVPLSALASIPPMLMSVAIVAGQSDRALAWRNHHRTPPPVPRVLFCSFLI
ncbi:hypothetical protein ELE36_10335 [Pseudolysobacter antarcticus]|uniref:Copper resistance protein n=2 Tax=Pseudolysobacter antarcticus TaxID=2511995 RepID=A0A411HQ75_9GAMM|nr:hypothetical protein ELE36_10335 [Pseudolysobacter antarcticus]